MILATTLNAVIGNSGSYISLIIIGIIVGYWVNRDIKNGIIHGGLIGVLGGVVSIIILLMVGGYLVITTSFINLTLQIILDIILGALGGAIGYILAKR